MLKIKNLRKRLRYTYALMSYYDVLILSLIASIAGVILESLPGSYLLDEITVPLIPAVIIQILGGYSFYLLGGLI